MKSREIFLILALASLFESCTAPSNQSIIVANARAPGGSCDFSDSTLYVENGSLDVSVYGSGSSYYQVFSWQNDLEDISVTYGSSNITAETPNTFVANRIDLSYQVLPPAVNPAPPPVTLPPGHINISAAITPGATFSNSSVGVYLLTTEAAQVLYPAVRQETLVYGAPVSYTVLVTFDLAGTLVGGGAAQTNTITYPLYVFYGIPTDPQCTLVCPAGTVSQVTSCNIPGRDLPYCLCSGSLPDGGTVDCNNLLVMSNCE